MSSSNPDDKHPRCFKRIQIANGDRLNISKLNINYVRNKKEMFHKIIIDKLDILMISETKLNDFF